MITNKKIRCLLIIASLLLPIGSATAVEISLTPSATDIPLGNTVNVDLRITGLGDFSPQSLGVFDLDVTFNSSILVFNNAVFGDPVLGDQLDLFGFGSITSVLTGIGSINLFELSFDLSSDLDSLQSGNFTLATLTFESLAAGTSALGIFVNDLGDADGSPLLATTIGTSISVNSIPEPGTLLLFGIGMLGLLFKASRR